MQTREAPVICLERVSKIFQQGAQTIRAVDHVSLEVTPGEFLAVTGASGSGKSTLLHLIAGLETPTTGTVRVGGVALESMDDTRLSTLRLRTMGFVFQFFHLLPALTAQENTALPLLLAGQSARRAAERAAELLTWVQLDRRLLSRPSELSGGEMQRVALARALANDPSIVLADEPTGNLDSHSGALVLELLYRSCKDMGKTLVLATHDQAVVQRADRVVALHDGALVTA
ncbi:MAG: ABC transporter ATP-binding protein [Candidatus Tectomicrobia bacterium]|uniref:ABC transporter ATP-binding protein n=1 Tax=Tectimicrobiota bacterium TaxID=2528274 RepID=A0A937W4N7_UNCTE|nr:ABC transporter ATP-binding protein [Candidatus Tectomicrobia bacterium]